MYYRVSLSLPRSFARVVMRAALSQQLISFNFVNFSLSFRFKSISEIVLGMSHEEETATSPDCSAESPAFLSPQSNNNLMYDQHSSEEELEVIMTKPIELDNNLIEMANENVNHHHQNHHQSQKNKLSSEGEISPKRCSSEKRKRSLAHNSDDEVILTVVLTVFLL